MILPILVIEKQIQTDTNATTISEKTYPKPIGIVCSVKYGSTHGTSASRVERFAKKTTTWLWLD